MGSIQVPRPPVGKVVIERVRFILLHDPHILQPAVRHLGQGDVDQAIHPPEGQRRLGAPIGERRKASACAAGQDDDEDAAALAANIATDESGTGHGPIIPRPAPKRAFPGSGPATVVSLGHQLQSQLSAGQSARTMLLWQVPSTGNLEAPVTRHSVSMTTDLATWAHRSAYGAGCVPPSGGLRGDPRCQSPGVSWATC